jgi:TonB family protein
MGQIMIAYYVVSAAAMIGNAPAMPTGSAYFARLDDPVNFLPPGQGSNPVPVGNPGLWVTTNDYPALALREEREGLVGFTLIVGTDGRVTSCEIASSSGSPDLDAAVCSLISLRARFTPARNAKGKVQPGRYASRVRWQIPSKGQNVAWKASVPQAGQVNQTFIVDENGKPSNCTISGSSVADNAKTPCDAGLTFQPYYNKQGERIRIKVQTSRTVSITEGNDLDLETK